MKSATLTLPTVRVVEHLWTNEEIVFQITQDDDRGRLSTYYLHFALISVSYVILNLINYRVLLFP